MVALELVYEAKLTWTCLYKVGLFFKENEMLDKAHMVCVLEMMFIFSKNNNDQCLKKGEKIDVGKSSLKMSVSDEQKNAHSVNFNT